MAEGSALQQQRKKRKTKEHEPARLCCSPFSSLDDDSLRAVLLRTRASDHPSLRLSCKRIRRVLDSVEYRKERSELGCAEVTVELLSPFEQYRREEENYRDTTTEPPTEYDKDFLENYDHLGYMGEYGDHNFGSSHIRVFVDDWALTQKLPNQKQNYCHEFSLNVKLLPRRVSFYDCCDSHSGSLSSMALALFTNSGRPAVKSLKKALCENDNKLPLLFIEDFELPLEYRSTKSTVGPLIIQELLRVFEDKYSLAIYIPFGSAQYNLDDIELKYRDPCRPGKEPTEEEIRSKQERRKRFRALTHKDMRQFFRAGFYQVNDSIILDNDTNYFVFITQQKAGQCILTEQQALDMPIAYPPPLPPERTGLVKEFLALIIKKCSKKELSQTSMTPIRRAGLEELAIIALEKIMKDDINEVLHKCESNEDRLRLILDSNSIHACAFHENLRVIKAILSVLPEPSRQTALALNSLDVEGYTPLMTFARRSSSSKSTSEGLKKSRQFAESLISLGADESVVHATTGLSALGYFRDGLREKIGHDIIFGYQEMEVLGVESGRIEQILKPAQGPTKADEDILNVTNDYTSDDGSSVGSDYDNDIDSDNYDDDNDY